MNKTNTKKSKVRRSAFGLLALVTAFVAETALAGSWSCAVLTEANPLPEAVNLLRGRLPTVSSRDGTATEFTKGYALRFTDGKIAIGDVWWNEFIEDGGAYVCYSVTDDLAGVALTSVRFTTTHKDKGRSQVRIAKLSVQTVTSGETWVELADSSVIGPEPQLGETNFQAVYAESDGRPIAEDVTAIRLDFDPEQQNHGVGFGEIEATALFLDGAWTCRRQKAAYALLPSANVLRDAEPAVSPDRMSVTYPLRDDGLALGGVRITSSPADGSRLSVASLQVKTVATGDSWYALPGSGIVTNEAGASAWEAFYANPENLPLAALGITALKVVFADGSAAGEAGLPVVEATEAGAASWSCRPRFLGVMRAFRCPARARGCGTTACRWRRRRRTGRASCATARTPSARTPTRRARAGSVGRLPLIRQSPRPCGFRPTAGPRNRLAAGVSSSSLTSVTWTAQRSGPCGRRFAPTPPPVGRVRR